MTLRRDLTDLRSTPDVWRRKAHAVLPVLAAGALVMGLPTKPAFAAQVSGYELKMPASAKAGDLTAFQPCTFKGLPARGSDTAECATLVVPEEPSKRQGRLLALPVVKLPALGEAGRDPIFWLTGGPGQSNLNYSVNVRGPLETHDVYMLGYRGADGQEPQQCPELLTAVVTPHPLSPEAGALIADAARLCAQRITASGVDLRQYSMVNVIGDYESLRIALGVRQVNLIGRSYGTRLAQYYTRLHPHSVRRSIQFGINPPGGFRWYPALTNGVLGEYAQLCAADPACSRRTPDLYKALLTTLARDDVSQGGSAVDMDKVRLGAMFLLGSKSGAVNLFDAVLAAEKGDNSGLARVSSLYEFAAPGGFIWGDLLSKGRGEPPTPTAQAFKAERRTTPTSFGSPLDLLIGAAASGWPAQSLPAGFDKAALDKTPTLLVSGNLDTNAPLKRSQTELLPYLPNGHLVILKNQAHEDWAKEQLPALDRLITGFLRDGIVDASGYVTSPVPFH